MIRSMAIAFRTCICVPLVVVCTAWGEAADGQAAFGEDHGSGAATDTSATDDPGAAAKDTTGDKAPPKARPATGVAAAQTADMVRWMAKRRQLELAGVSYGVTGLPIFYYSPNTGWNYGFRAQWADLQRRPYRYKVTVYWVGSTENKYTRYVKLKVPNISGTGFGLRLIAGTRRDIRARYYGLGNGSERVTEWYDPKSPEFRDEDYYHYVLKEPRFIVSLLRHVYGPVSLSAGLGLETTDIDARGDSSFYQLDLRGGKLSNEGTAVDAVTGFISFTLNWDTRDDPTIPRRGSFHEWSYESSRNSLLGLLLEEIDFRRYTVTDSRYFSLSERLNLANRVIFEALKGNVPLYAYGEVGGSRRVRGLGGGDTLRGFDRQRFTDNIRLITNTELRYRIHSQRAFKQYLEWHSAFFIDTGQVGPGVGELGPLDSHVTGGMGIRMYWNADFVIRADLGLSPEQVYLGMKYRNVF
ncbi:BamA/TamA family outer membrane protein [Candidatus Latescibacterota bacterium]